MPQFEKSLVWFRRDLRCTDHAALHHALKTSRQVVCAFIFDQAILQALPRADRRVEFIHAAIEELAGGLATLGGALIVRHSVGEEEIPRLAAELGVDAVFVNHDYEPAAIARDRAVELELRESGTAFLSFKDQVIFEKSEVLSLSATPFSIFTPYKNAWLKKLAAGNDGDDYLQPWLIEPWAARLAPADLRTASRPTLAELGFEKTNLAELAIPTGMSGAASMLEQFRARIGQYEEARNFPAVQGTSGLSVHLRFGTISIRSLARLAYDAVRSGSAGGGGAAVWLSELIWRDFYFMILFHHPHVAERAFKPAYDKIEWEAGPAAEELFQAWCEARTGYPLVDAAMLQLNQTGFMHNRLRMVSACFLIKDLGIDWRWGERYFAEKLNDFDLAANNGGWQWASSSGCDAQPYFRIFNPVTQSEKFDAQGKFIRHFLPQLAGLSAREIHAPWLVASRLWDLPGPTYPAPIVAHDEARKLTLARYSVVKTGLSLDDGGA